MELDELLVRYLPGIEAFVRLQMGPALRARESCSDVLQSVAREVLEERQRFEFRGEAAFRHWLCTRAHHKVLEHHRWHSAGKRDLAREQGDDDALLGCYRTLGSPSQELVSKEAVAVIERAFDELPADYREAIALHRLVGLSHAEVAAQMGRSEGAVRNLVYRGLARMALQLAGEDEPAA